jgi:putative glutamine amidotransferase
MTSPKPIIGISLSARCEPENDQNHGLCTINWNYPEAIVLAGGMPFGILPMTDPDFVADAIDGWLIIGGDDIDSTIYGQKRHPKAGLVDSQRYAGEAAVLKHLPKEMPVFGICYGCQFINVQHGGSLHQHIPDIVGHEEHAGGTLAEYDVVPGTKLHSVVQELKIRGKSYHHQAVDRVGDGLVVSARHADGTIECVESVERPWMIGVQWHPERTLEDILTQRLFSAFVEAAAAFRACRG